MASGINYTSIDRDYPVAGQDNDSQGFRDNFGYIKDGLSTAASEITALQTTTAKTNADTNFGWQKVSQAAFTYCGDVIYNPQTPVAASSDSLATILCTNGPLQIFRVAGDLTFTLSAFPPNPTNPLNNTSVVSKMRIHLTSSEGATHLITFATTGGTILKDSGTVNPVSVSSASHPIVIDFWTFDAGVTVYMNYIGTFS